MTAGSSVWLVGQRTSREQRRGRYLFESYAHPAKMAPALARQAIETFTSPGDLVADPMCGVGTTLVEAIHLGRDAVGVEYEPRWATLAAANLAFARDNGAPGEGEVVAGDCRHVRSLVPPEMVGQVALVLTSPPYGPSTHGHVRCTPRGVEKRNVAYSGDRANLAYGATDQLLAAMSELFRELRSLLHRDGHVVLTARPWRRSGHFMDLPGSLVTTAQTAGFTLLERDVALLAGLRGERLVPRASFFQLQEARRARAAGRPQLVIGHEDVLVFGRRRTPVSSSPLNRVP